MFPPTDVQLVFKGKAFLSPQCGVTGNEHCGQRRWKPGPTWDLCWNCRSAKRTCISLVSEKQRIHDIDHQRGPWWPSVMLHPSCIEEVEIPGQKHMEVKSLAKPEQVLWGVEMPKNKSGELQLAPPALPGPAACLTCSEAPLPPSHLPTQGEPEHCSSLQHSEPVPKGAVSWQARAGRLEGQFQGCRTRGKSRRAQLQHHPLQREKSMENTQGDCGCSVNQLSLPGHECRQQVERSRESLEAWPT